MDVNAVNGRIFLYPIALVANLYKNEESIVRINDVISDPFQPKKELDRVVSYLPFYLPYMANT